MSAYLDGEITLHDFYRWFTAETWDMQDDDEEYKLYCQIAGLFGEYTTWWNGQRGRTEESLRIEFAKKKKKEKESNQ